MKILLNLRLILKSDTYINASVSIKSEIISYHPGFLNLPFKI